VSYSEEWLKAVRAKIEPESRIIATPPIEPAPAASPTWKPWAQMTAEERRKALSEREGGK
jgi:hypothetical protein